MCSVEQKPVFRDLTGEDPDPEVTEIESLCMNCHSSGMTRLLLTRIPYYKNVVIMSFSCEECGYENNEIQPGGAFAELGVRWKLHVDTQTDLNRQVVKSDYTSVRIPELDFEIPAQSQKGEVTTVEGIISRAVSGLTQDQSARREQHPEAAEQIDRFVARLQELRHLEKKWTLELEDISGNCFVENPEAPRKDPRCERSDFARSPEQNHALGIFTRDEVSEEPEPKLPVATDSLLTPADPANCTYDAMAGDEVLQFRTNCPECNAPADTNMKLTTYRFVNIFNDSLYFVEYICQCCHCVYEVLEGDRVLEVETNCPLCDTTIDPDMRPPKIPHFKEVVIMATICDACGHRTNEVKSGGGVEDKGVRFEVRVANKDDFSRDILKSETCRMEIPELELDVGGRALGGRFTTAEGLLRATVEQLADAPGVVGDAPSLAADSLDTFVAKLNEVLDSKRSITIVLDDPAGNSYVQSLNDEDPSMPDDGLKITRYERSFEQNEELGLNDLKTEGYEAT